LQEEGKAMVGTDPIVQVDIGPRGSDTGKVSRLGGEVIPQETFPVTFLIVHDPGTIRE
jgi:hypothetical protein